ncbi:transposase family protein [Roseinatronobacter sp.]
MSTLWHTSRHVYSRYQRQPADLPAHGRKVQLALLVRRFSCRAMCCLTKIFVKRFPPYVTRPHTRRTSRQQRLSGSSAWHSAVAWHRHSLDGYSYAYGLA